MKKFMKLFGAVGLLGALMMAGGCGSDSTPVYFFPSTTSAVSTPIAVATNADGTAKTTAAQTATPKADAPNQFQKGYKLIIPENTKITATDASGKIVTIPANPEFIYTLPVDTTTSTSGVSGVPVPTGSKAVTATEAAVDVKINLAGASITTFDKPISVVIPVYPMPGQTAIQKVYIIKNGTTYVSVPPPPGATNFPITNGTITVQVSDFCWFVGDPLFQSATGGSSPTPF